MLWIIKGMGYLALALYAAYPIGFRFSSSVRRNAVFFPFVDKPKDVDFDDTQLYINATRNFYIETEEGVTIGAWHVLPKSLMDTAYEKGEYERSLSDGFPIVLYLHGVCGTRITGHRVELYKRLQAMDCHVIALDYRGFADSVSTVPLSENGVITDAKAAYSYIKKHSGDSKVIVWGHSLGTGVASRTVSELCIDDNAPHGMVLEAPFNNLLEAAAQTPWNKIYYPVSFMRPIFDWFFIYPLVEDEITFESDHHIKYINRPIVILHAEDDTVINSSLTNKLYRSAVNSRSEEWPSVQYNEFKQSLGYGHVNIYQAPELPAIVRGLLENETVGKSETKLISP